MGLTASCHLCYGSKGCKTMPKTVGAEALSIQDNAFCVSVTPTEEKSFYDKNLEISLLSDNAARKACRCLVSWHTGEIFLIENIV